jgi:hypothetical protein
MTIVQALHNQYHGVNAHLHSLFQSTEGGWVSFHAAHIIHIADSLNQVLAPLGYRAVPEESLQIRRLDEGLYRPEADILIFDTPVRPLSASRVSADVAEMPKMLSLPSLYVDELSERPYIAIAIVQGRRRGYTPVVWIELLSPTNKGSTPDADTYIRKRNTLLNDGLVFVEIDYLHETPQTFPRLPRYRSKKPDAHPYQIIVLDSRPSFDEGRAWRYGFDVDMTIPKVTIPLNDNEAIQFDFDAVYQHTFASGLFGDDVNYVEYPLNFQRYTPDDQSAIMRRMVAVLQAFAQSNPLTDQLMPVLPYIEWSTEELQVRLEAQIAALKPTPPTSA